MRTLAIVALFLSAPTLAAETCPPIPRVHAPGFKCKPGLVRVRCDGRVRCLRPGQCPAHPVPQVAVPKPPPVTPSPAPVPPPAPRVMAQPPVTVPPVAIPAPPSAWHIGPYAQFGSGITEPRSKFSRSYSTPDNGGLIEWDIGFHAHYLPARLGGRVYYAGNYGAGGQLELYLLQGEGLEIHLDAGVLLYGTNMVASGVPGSERNYASTVDVERLWDLQYGLGAELPLLKGLTLTLDARASQPLSRQDAGRWSYDSGDTALNALHQFHLLAGVMFRM